MKYGLFGLNQNVLVDAEAAATVASAAEAAGFDSLWVGEHVVLPDPHVPPSPMMPEEAILDPIVALSFLAAHTRNIFLGTGVIILPQRNPVVLAKELASLDVLSQGRLIFGVGVGYLEPEMKAIGVSMEHRGTRSDEYLAAVLALWTQPKPTFHGRYVQFEGIQAYPRPYRQPRPPIIIGGRTSAAHRRAIRFGDGWYGFNLDFNEAAHQIQELHLAAQQTERGSGLSTLEISLTPRETINAEMAHWFAKLGVHRLILRLPKNADLAQTLSFVNTTAGSLITGT